MLSAELTAFCLVLVEGTANPARQHDTYQDNPNERRAKSFLTGLMAKPSKAINPNHILEDATVSAGAYRGDARFQKGKDCLRCLFALTGKRLYLSSLSVARHIHCKQCRQGAGGVFPDTKMPALVHIASALSLTLQAKTYKRSKKKTTFRLFMPSFYI